MSFKENSMNSFMLGYHGGRRPSSEEEGKAHMEKWEAWVKGLGDAVVNPGTPIMASKTVTSSQVEDGDEKSMKGFAIIKANSMDEAIEISKSDPFLEIGGTIKISQMMDTPSK
jgi:hypothetical protein